MLVFQRPEYLEDDYGKAILPETVAMNHILFTKQSKGDDISSHTSCTSEMEAMLEINVFYINKESFRN